MVRNFGIEASCRATSPCLTPHALPKLLARQPHCLIARRELIVELLLQAKVVQRGAHGLVDEQRQQPSVVAKGKPHQAIWVVDLGAQPRQPRDHVVEFVHCRASSGSTNLTFSASPRSSNSVTARRPATAWRSGAPPAGMTAAGRHRPARAPCCSRTAADIAI